MKWDCDARRERRQQKWRERLKALEEWHLWFAWFPVKVAPHDCRWLEVVERKSKFFDYGLPWFVGAWVDEYRPLTPGENKEKERV